VSRHDRFGERLDDDEPTLWQTAAPLPARVCQLCTKQLAPSNASAICAECRLVVHNLFDRPVEERWRDHPDGEHIVSDRGRIARLLNVDRAHRYPRVSIAGSKRYVHAMVAEAWHGPRPAGLLVLHADDDPDRPHADNLRYGTRADNAADAKRNRINREGDTA
jgi:hypothetical protein